MSKKANISLFFKGKTQAERLLPALDPNTFKIDDRNSLDLLAFISKFSKAFKYYNPQNKADGNWQELLLDDPSMLLAYIIKTNYFMELPRYLDYKAGIDATKILNTKKLFAQQYFSIGFHVVLRINRWYKLSNKSLSHHAFRDYLYEFITEEGRQALQDYYLIYFKLCEWISCCKNQSLVKLEALDRVWLFQPFPCIEKRILELTDESLLDSLVAEAVKTGQRLFHLQEKIIKKANIFFQESITRKDVSPDIGLLLAFLDLFKLQQIDLNQLTESHLDFYYNSILGFKPLPALPDTTHIQLTKGNQPFVLSENSSFSAGNDSTGKPIVFSTQKALNINKSELSQYLTLSLTFDNKPRGLLALETSPPLNFGGLYNGTIKKFTTLSSQSWPFFGAADSTNPNYTIKEEKDALGFAISCPELILNSGERSISFIFSKKEKPEGQIVDLGLINTKLFNFQLTVAKGWQLFEGQCVSINDDYIKFKLKLLTSDPAIVPYNEKIHKAGLNIKQDWPVCKITLAKGTTFTDFEKISNFTFENISVNCSVKGTQSLVLQNDKGKLSPKSTFYPFGNTPFPDANLFFGGQELFIKPLDSLVLNILWNHLPDNFEAYYKGYPSIYTNQIFKANLSCFDPKLQTWKTLNVEGDDTGKTPVKESNIENRFTLFTPGLIFSSEEDVGNKISVPLPLLENRSIKFSVDGITPQPDLPEILQYSQKQSNAFFKLTLVEPSQGFGTDEYPQLLSKTTLENGQAIIWNANNCKENTSVCKFLEECYEVKSELENLELQFINEIEKLYEIYIILIAYFKEVDEIKAGCESDAIKKELISDLQTNYSEEIHEIILVCKTSVLQIAKEIFQIVEDFLKKFCGFILKETEDVLKEDIKTIRKYLINFVDSIFTELEKLIVSKTNKKLAEIERVVLFELKNKIIEIINNWPNNEPKPRVNIFSSVTKFFRTEISKDLSKKDNILLNDYEAVTTKLLTLLKQNIKRINVKVEQILKVDLKNNQDADPAILIKNPKNILEVWTKEVTEKVERYKDGMGVFTSLVNGKQGLVNYLLGLINKINYIPLKPLPNKPFIPKIKKLSVDYKSSSQWKSDEKKPLPQLDFQFFHLEPFGNKEMANDTSPIKIFPDFQNVAYAFLGFEHLSAGETLTILFNITSQVKSMTTSSSSQVNYEYLTLDGWQTLHLDADGTFDLVQSGIIQFVVPNEMTDQSTIMPKGIFWIRIAEPLDRMNKAAIMTNFVGIHVVPAQRVIRDETNLKQIEAGIINSAIDASKSIKNIQQPIPSFGGRKAETKKQSFQRAAYRLNNKNRAVTLRDMENLILQTFSNLYQVIAIPMRQFNPNENNLLRIVTIPFTNLKDDHPFRPLVLPSMMRDILEFSEKYCPPSMGLNLVNPNFYSIKVTVSVVFKNQNDIGLLSKKLNSDLIFYLSPWVEDNPFDAEKSNKKSLAALHAFVLSRPYVKQVGGIKFLIKDETTEEELIDQNKIYPWDLLVPALEHCIKNTNFKNELNKNNDSRGIKKKSSFKT